MFEVRINPRLLLILIMIPTLGLQACAVSSNLPEDMVGGEWFLPEEALFIEFFDDGTFLSVSGPISIDGKGAFARKGEYTFIDKKLIQIGRGNVFSDTEDEFTVELNRESLKIGTSLLYKMEDNLSPISVKDDPVTYQQYSGLWENQNPRTRGVPAVYVFPGQGGQLLIQAWGFCQPEWCDWGVNEAQAADQFLYSFWDHGHSKMHMMLVPTDDDQLQINIVTYFTDNSERSEFTTREEFIRSPTLSVPADLE